MDRQGPAAARLALPTRLAAAQAWRAVSRWLPLLAVVAVALALRPIEGTNTDVSWLITAGEKMLAGERLYVDILEVNPPASVFLYLLPVVLARALGIAPEIVVNVFVSAGAAASLSICAAILKRVRWVNGIDGWMFFVAGTAVLTILPAYAFGQREHIAVMALLPFLSVLALRMDGVAPRLVEILIAGIGAGITIVIKPHFSLAVAFAIMAAAAGARSWRALFVAENWIAGAIAALYGAFVVAAFPEFVRNILPAAQMAYVPFREAIVFSLLRPPALIWLAALRVLTLWRPGGLWAPPYSLLIAPSAGFLIAYLVQGKGWPYHSYPMLALALIALSIAWLERRAKLQGANAIELPRFKRAAIAFVLPGLFVASFVWLNLARHMDSLVDAVREVKQRPRILIISFDPSVGHPLARLLGGTWVGRAAHLWISGGAFHILTRENPDEATKAELRRLVAQDRDNLVEDIERGKPDVIIVDRRKFDWMEWARWDEKVNRALASYREAKFHKGFAILKRSGDGPAKAAAGR